MRSSGVALVLLATISMIVYSNATVISVSASSEGSSNPIPIVIWHGMGDCCCNPMSMGSIKGMLEKQIPGVYVHSLMIGTNVAQDTKNGFFMNVNDQIKMACEKIKEDPKLQNG